jgi:hypothetical protein
MTGNSGFRAVELSPEEQRLRQIYRKHGLPGEIEELKRVNCGRAPYW